MSQHYSAKKSDTPVPVVKFPAAPGWPQKSAVSAYDEICAALSVNQTATAADLPAIRLTARMLGRANDLLDEVGRGEAAGTAANAASKCALEFLRALGLTPRARASVERLSPQSKRTPLDEFDDEA